MEQFSNLQNDPSNFPQETHPKKYNSIIIGIIILVAIVGLAVGGVLTYRNIIAQREHELNMKIIAKEEEKERLEKAREESIRIAEEAKEAEYEARVRDFNALASALRSLPVNEYYSYYVLQDITGDGMPELIANTGTCEADAEINIFTTRNGVPYKLGTFPSGHSGITGGNNCIYVYMMHMGESMEWRITSNGNTIYDNQTYHSSMYTEDGEMNENWDPRSPSGTYLQRYEYSDLKPIRKAFQLD